MKNITEINFNSINDAAKFMEVLIQETSIKAEVNLLTDGSWLLKVSGASEEHCQRCLDRCDSKGFIRI